MSPQTNKQQGKNQRTSQRVVAKKLAAKNTEEMYLSELLDNAKEEEKKLRELHAAETKAAGEETKRKDEKFRE